MTTSTLTWRTIASFLIAALLTTTALASAPARPPTAVIVENAAQKRIADSLEALGTLQANESVTITAKVADTISAVRFDDGQAVAAGDVLVAQTDSEETALLREAESLAEEAKRQYERIKSLVKQGSASESLLDERRQTWRTAQAREDAVRSRLKDRLITAPFSGQVGLRQVSPGALVSPGDVITTLVDITSMKLDFTIPATYLDTVQVGTPIDATSPVYPLRHFEGAVTSIDNTIDPVTRSITVRAVLPNNDLSLVPGMLMTLNLQRNPRDAVVISEEAIIPQGGETYVLVVDHSNEPKTAERRVVTLGRRFAGTVEVRAGLKAGETVISHGTLKVRPGSPIRIQAVDDGTRSIAEMIRQAPASSG